MKHAGQSQILSKIVSPYGLAAISYAFFLFATSIPATTYSRYMNEPDMMFLDTTTILFYTLCVASFIAGVWFISNLFPSAFIDRRIDTRINPTALIMVPLVLAIAIAAIVDTYLVKNYPVILVSLLAQRGGDIKETVALDVDGHLNFAPLFLIGVTWWAFWRYSELDLRGWRRRLVAFSILVAVLTIVVSATLTLSRDTVMLGVFGLAISYIARCTKNGQISPEFILKSSLTMVIGIASLFFAFSFLRGNANWDDQIRTLMGYTAASYNRLAAIVNGRLHYPFAGGGIYLSNVVAHSRFLLIGKILQSPSGIDVWGSEFGAVSQAGLDGSLIWSGAFGDIFTELGWFSPLFVFGYGILYGVVWSWIKRGKVLGVVLYPFFGFCVLFWLGTNYLLDQPAEVLLSIAVLLSIYESVFVRFGKPFLSAEIG